ncbi:Conserved_hypothetical protein [Hexamita inflata]|uniref:Uncharacterized protein n=1 Tax=Hexamita inflata TaxID=28002 RepID=A0AA86NY17_9EUKA|nr:Conserved hypothetical protein [Hexamita inflata]
MCIDCYETVPRRNTDDGWIPVNHQCHNQDFAAVRIPFQNDQQKQQYIFKAQYLIAARIPYIQTIYDFFVVGSEIILITRRPQITLSDMLAQSSQTDAQQLSAAYSIASSIFLSHRHKILVGNVSFRDYYVFQDSYVSLSVESLVKQKCQCVTPRTDVMNMCNLILQIYNDQNQIDSKPCQQCKQKTLREDDIDRLILQLNNQSSPYKMIVKLLQSFNWIEGQRGFLSQTRISPFYDESVTEFNTRKCSKVQGNTFTRQKNKRIDKEEEADSKAEILSAKIVKDFNIDINIVEAYMGITSLIQVGGLDNKSTDSIIQMPLIQYLSEIKYQPREPLSKIQIVIVRIKQRIEKEKLQQDVLVVNEVKLNDKDIKQIKESLNKIYQSKQSSYLEDYIVLIRMILYNEGTTFIKDDRNAIPYNFYPIIPVLDIQQQKASNNVISINIDERIIQLQKQVEFLNSLKGDRNFDQINNIIQVQFCQVLQYLTIQCMKQSDLQQCTQFNIQFSERNLINKMYQKITQVPIKDIKSQNIVITDQMLQQIEQLYQQLISVGIPGNEIQLTKTIRDEFITSQVKSVKQQLTAVQAIRVCSLSITFIDFIICHSGIQILQERSVFKKKFHYLYNFRNAQSELQNSPEQYKSQQVFFSNLLILAISMIEIEQSQEAMLLLMNIICPDMFKLIFYQTPCVFKHNQHVLRRIINIQNNQMQQKILTPVENQCYCDQKEEICKNCAHKRSQQIKERVEILKQTIFSEDNIPISKMITQQLTDYRKFQKEQFYTLQMQDIILKTVQMNVQNHQLFQQQLFNAQLSDGFYINCVNQFFTSKSLPLSFMELISSFVDNSTIELYIQQNNLTIITFIDEQLKYFNQPSNYKIQDVDQQQKILCVVEVLQRITFFGHSLQYLLQNIKQNMTNYQGRQSESQTIKTLFDDVFGSQIEFFENFYKFPYEFVETISAITLLPIDYFTNCSIFSLNPKQYIYPIVKFCHLLIQFNNQIQKFNKINISKGVKECIQSMNLTVVQNIFNKILIQKSIIQFGADYQCLELISQCAYFVALPLQYITQLFQVESIKSLLLLENPDNVIEMYSRLLLSVRQLSSKFVEMRTEQIKQQQQQPQGKDLISLKTQIAPKLNPAFYQSIRASAQIAKNEANQININKIQQVIVDGVELLGHKFLYVAASVLAELSFDQNFWDEEGPDVYIFMQNLLKAYIDQNQQSIKKQMPAQLAEDIIVVLINTYKRGLLNFQKISNTSVLNSLFQFNVKENSLIFILVAIKELISLQPEQTLTQFGDKLINCYKQNLLRTHCLSILIQGITLIKLIKEQLSQILFKFYSVAFDGKKQTDMQLRDILKLIQLMIDGNVMQGFAEAQICYVLVDLLKQKPNDIKYQIINIMYACKDNEKITKGFAELGVANVLKRLTVPDQLKEKYQLLCQLYKQ